MGVDTAWNSDKEFPVSFDTERTQPSAEAQEALLLVDDATYLHVQSCDTGWDYTLYDAATMKQLDGGQLDAPELSLSTAALKICEMRGMVQLGTKNREAYLRKMALDGYVVRLELPELKELVSLMRYSSNNLNQLTRRVHETGRIYDADLEDISRRQEALWDGVHSYLCNRAGRKDRKGK